MAVITVNSSKSLISAVAAAKDGDVIKMAAGTYSGVVISGANFLKGVTITSADPTHPAVLTDLMVAKSKGLTFQGLDLLNTKNADLPFQITTSSNIVMDHLDVTGTGNTVAALNARLMIIRNSTNVQVTNSEFAYGWHGISMLGNKQVTIADNYFHDLRTDGVRGGGNSYLTIKANVFTSFHPTATDHPDAIQLWTVNTSGASTNIVIDENVIYRGAGSSVQGIFLRDTSGHMPFTNLTVTNNIIEGARFNGIAVTGAQNGTMSNNIVQAFSDQPSGIRLGAATGVTVSNNQTTTFYTTLKGIAGQAGNALIGVAGDKGAAMIGAWLKNHSGFVSAWQGSDPAVLSALLKLSSTIIPTPTPTPSPAPTKSISTIVDSALAVSTLAISNTDDHTATTTLLHKTTAMSTVAVDDQGIAVHDDSGALSDDHVPAIPASDVHATNDDGSGGDILDLSAYALVISDDSAAGDDAGTDDNDYTVALSDDMIASEDNAVSDNANVVSIEHGTKGEVDATAGTDLFRFSVDDQPLSKGRPIIVGFESGVDKIIVADETINAAQNPSQPLNFIGTSGFTGHAGEIRYTDSTDGVIVQTDINGDGIADLEFSLRDVHAVSVRDFIL